MHTRTDVKRLHALSAKIDADRFHIFRAPQHVALHLEGYKTHSEVERAVMPRYFLFNLANVFVTIGAGSIAEVSWSSRRLCCCSTADDSASPAASSVLL